MGLKKWRVIGAWGTGPWESSCFRLPWQSYSWDTLGPTATPKNPTSHQPLYSQAKWPNSSYVLDHYGSTQVRTKNAWSKCYMLNASHSYQIHAEHITFQKQRHNSFIKPGITKFCTIAGYSLESSCRSFRDEILMKPWETGKLIIPSGLYAGEQHSNTL